MKITVMKKNTNNERRKFLKAIPIAIASAGALSMLRFSKGKPSKPEISYKTLSVKEANELLRNHSRPVTMRIKPKPSPVRKQQENQQA